MKKFVLAVISVLALAGSARAFASSDPEFIHYYTVADNLSTAAKNVFSLNEIPWLYAEIPDQYNGGTDWIPRVFAGWDSLVNPHYGSETYDLVLGGSKTQREFWLKPRDWDSVKQLGVWNINGDYAYIVGANLPQNQGAYTQFTVTPEPASMALFGLGALALGAGRLRRKRK